MRTNPISDTPLAIFPFAIIEEEARFLPAGSAKIGYRYRFGWEITKVYIVAVIEVYRARLRSNHYIIINPDEIVLPSVQ